MIGQYVRVITAPSVMGVVIGARFDRGHVRFLFRRDPRFPGQFADIWLLGSDVEGFTKPTDDQVTAINKPARNRYLPIALAPRNRIGIIQAARFDQGHVSYLFHRNDTSSDVWLLDSDLEECASPTDDHPVFERLKEVPDL
jgi:hypothetical protein